MTSKSLPVITPSRSRRQHSILASLTHTFSPIALPETAKLRNLLHRRRIRCVTTPAANNYRHAFSAIPSSEFLDILPRGRISYIASSMSYGHTGSLSVCSHDDKHILCLSFAISTRNTIAFFLIITISSRLSADESSDKFNLFLYARCRDASRGDYSRNAGYMPVITSLYL